MTCNLGPRLNLLQSAYFFARPVFAFSFCCLRFLYLSRFGFGRLEACEPVVGGKMLKCKHRSKQRRQSAPDTFDLVLFSEDIFWKLNGPCRKCDSPVSCSSSAHWTYLSPSGCRCGANKTLSPKIISSVSSHFEYSYQSGHHRANSSLFALLAGCFARNVQCIQKLWLSFSIIPRYINIY